MDGIAPIRVALGRSRALAAALVAVHAGAAGCAAALSIPAPARLVLVALVAIGALRALSEHATRRRPCSVSALSSGAGEWRVLRRDGSVERASALRVRLCAPWLVVLVPHRRGARAIVVPGDAAPADDFRRLRAVLVEGRGEPAGRGTS